MATRGGTKTEIVWNGLAKRPLLRQWKCRLQEDHLNIYSISVYLRVFARIAVRVCLWHSTNPSQCDGKTRWLRPKVSKDGALRSQMTLGTFSAIRLTSHHVFVNCNGKHYVANCIGTTSLRHWSQCHKILQKRSQALPYNVNLENLTSRHFPLITKTRQRGLRFLQPLYELSLKSNISALVYIFPFLLILFYDIQVNLWPVMDIDNAQPNPPSTYKQNNSVHSALYPN